VEKREAAYTTGGKVNWYFTMENIMDIPSKNKIEISYDPAISLLGIYP